ncbi:tripartite tricarboxylate transporter substrate binding protein [Candidimonas sp. SYP-B2681]|uniref:Bug family tripartite tricarboxylate transporter substrate binding protein n=1 Tax=Candidimonas sp. SYP-B2681 TaxID=2497686 RepID=UPI000F86B1B8|nr:tripartite tricarboxylate transporter substrate binding protein [Candidimonas sp. SYP-B2681]RTZ38882.1 tripartite tricarboxylate transporter substrate binding protein [Candidimonas sp. SYP-B2681]
MRTFSSWSKKLLFAAMLAIPAAGAIAAEPFPSRTIEWVVPYPAGGGTDIVARTLAQYMSKILGQNIVILNKSGAATAIGAEYVARASADGHVLLSADTATLAANPFIYKKLSYDAEKDFASIGLTVRFPMILVVNPKVPAKNLEEFIAWAKTQPEVPYATPGSGSPHHLATELFREMTGLKLSHIPYRGAAPAVQDVVAGQVPFMFVDTASGQQYISSGRLRAIGVASPKRVKNFDTIPTLDEQGLKGFEAYAWQGLVAPAGTPVAAIDKLNKAMLAAMETPEVKEKLTTLGLEAIPSTPEEMTKFAADERIKWSKVIKASGISAD